MILLCGKLLLLQQMSTVVVDMAALCCSEEQAKLAARKYARIVQKLGFPVSGLTLFVLKISQVVK